DLDAVLHPRDGVRHRQLVVLELDRAHVEPIDDEQMSEPLDHFARRISSSRSTTRSTPWKSGATVTRPVSFSMSAVTASTSEGWRRSVFSVMAATFRSLTISSAWICRASGWIGYPGNPS